MPCASSDIFCYAAGMLYLVGLGLGDAEDITLKGLKIVQRAKRVYLEAYTSILSVSIEALAFFCLLCGGRLKKAEMQNFGGRKENVYGREVILADREMVEQHAGELLQDAETEDIVLLVVGDPFGATTHTDIILRAKQRGIPYKVIHNASIINAVGCCGLQLYNFGEIISIPFWTETWQPDSFYDKISANRHRGLHTLCLLDIKLKEQSVENIIKGKLIYEPPRFMTVNQAATQLLQIVERKKEHVEKESVALTGNTLCIAVARVGHDDQKIVAAKLSKMVEVDLGGPLHSLVIAGHMHPLEVDMAKLFASDETVL